MYIHIHTKLNTSEHSSATQTERWAEERELQKRPQEAGEASDTPPTTLSCMRTCVCVCERESIRQRMRLTRLPLHSRACVPEREREREREHTSAYASDTPPTTLSCMRTCVCVRERESIRQRMSAYASYYTLVHAYLCVCVVCEHTCV